MDGYMIIDLLPPYGTAFAWCGQVVSLHCQHRWNSPWEVMVVIDKKKRYFCLKGYNLVDLHVTWTW